MSLYYNFICTQIKPETTDLAETFLWVRGAFSAQKHANSNICSFTTPVQTQSGKNGHKNGKKLNGFDYN